MRFIIRFCRYFLFFAVAFGASDVGIADNKQRPAGSNSVRSNSTNRPIRLNSENMQLEMQRSTATQMRAEQLRKKLEQGSCQKPPCKKNVLDKIR